jgi:hypothetical protein
LCRVAALVSPPTTYERWPTHLRKRPRCLRPRTVCASTPGQTQATLWCRWGQRGEHGRQGCPRSRRRKKAHSHCVGMRRPSLTSQSTASLSSSHGEQKQFTLVSHCSFSSDDHRTDRFSPSQERHSAEACSRHSPKNGSMRFTALLFKQRSCLLAGIGHDWLQWPYPPTVTHPPCLTRCFFSLAAAPRTARDKIHLTGFTPQSELLHMFANSNSWPALHQLHSSSHNSTITPHKHAHTHNAYLSETR